MATSLRKVVIKNYRSIRDLTLTSDNACQVLIGINESGKTNILSAISLFDPSAKTSTRDIRELPPDEKDGESHITFSCDIPLVYRRIIANKLQSAMAVPVTHCVATVGGEQLTLRELCEKHLATYEVRVSINDGKRTETFNSVEGEIGQGLLFPSAVPDDVTFTNSAGQKTQVNKLEYLTPKTVADHDLPIAGLVEPDFETLWSDIDRYAKPYLTGMTPRVINWRYDEANLLPAEIPIADFAKSPDKFLPLKYLFHMAGIEKITAEIEAATGKSSNAVRNLLSRVSKHATDHFRQTWKDYKSIAFDIYPDGEVIKPAIRDVHNHYEMSQRSD